MIVAGPAWGLYEKKLSRRSLAIRQGCVDSLVSGFRKHKSVGTERAKLRVTKELPI